MRICKQCDCEMLEGFDIKIEGKENGIKISKGSGSFLGIFADSRIKPKVAICPKCGEVSLYIENVNDILENK